MMISFFLVVVGFVNVDIYVEIEWFLSEGEIIVVQSGQIFFGGKGVN